MSVEEEINVKDPQMRGEGVWEEINNVWPWQRISKKNNVKSHQERGPGVE